MHAPIINKKYIIPTLLLGGFIFDIITFKSIELHTAFLILIAHLVIVACAIIATHISPTNSTKIFVQKISPYFMQFSFGALLSASLIFYWFSGSWSASWPIFTILIILMISNEIFAKLIQQTSAHIALLSFTLLSTLSLIYPSIFASIAPSMFILAGITGYTIMYVYITFITTQITNLTHQKRKFITITSIIFIIFNIAYFTNLLPPIPLALTDAGIYHTVERTPSGYLIQAEKESILQKILPGTNITTQPHQPIIAFTSIFAPTTLNTKIVHLWEFQNPQTNEWIHKHKLSYNISGGRKNGYRGYTKITNHAEGSWRVKIQTTRGQTLAVIPFEITYSNNQPSLTKITK